MKNSIPLFLLAFSFFTTQLVAQEVDPSAALEVSSTSRGFLPPRMTPAQCDAISNPAVGLMIYNTDAERIDYYHPDDGWRDASFNPAAAIFHNGKFYGVVKTPTGRYWLDRNLGADQVATSSTDTNSFGDLFQWGRGADGHEKRGSGTTTSNDNNPGHGDFIIENNFPYDWRSSTNDNLWQGVNGVNNPCPPSFRLPTKSEWDLEESNFSPNDLEGAFKSELKLPDSGHRANNGDEETSTFYWSSSSYTSGALKEAWSLFLRYSAATNNAYTVTGRRASGRAVRCIKD